MDAEGGRRWWKGWDPRSMKALLLSCALAFVLLTAYGYYAFPSQGMVNLEVGLGGAVALFLLGLFVFLMNEHMKDRQRAGEQVRF